MDLPMPTFPPPLPITTPTSRKDNKSSPANKPSLLLSAEENEIVFDIIGPSSKTLATAVVQLLYPTPDQRQWQYVETGVACLVRDEVIKSHYIEVLSLTTFAAVFSQEIYKEFTYKVAKQVFVTFEGDDHMVSLNFADSTEAGNFCEALNRRMRVKSVKQKRDGRKSVDVGNTKLAPAPITKPPPVIVTGGANKINYGQTAKLKMKIDKSDIGQPYNLQYIEGTRFNDVSKIYSDPIFQYFFEKAGISKDELKDEHTREFIENFIKNNGGVAAFTENIQETILSRPKSPVPPRRPPPPQRPSDLKSQLNAFDQDLPLPPPPEDFLIVDSTPRNKPPLLPPNIPDCPLPPPPPPLVPQPLPQTPDKIGGSPNTGGLKPTPPCHSDPNAKLLEAIRGPKKLKPVDPSEPKSKPPLPGGKKDLMTLFVEAMKDRRGYIADSGESGSSSGNESWDDE